MSNNTNPTPTAARRIIVLVGILVVAVLFLSSLYYRWENPSLQKAVRPTGQSAGMPPQGEGMGGMGGMDMEGVRTMVEALEKRLELNPADSEALFQMESIRSMRGDREGAAAYLERIEALGLTDKAQLMELAGRWFNLEDHARAARTLEGILALDPEEMFAHYNLGVLYKYRLAEPEKARMHLEKVAKGEHSFEELRTQAAKELESK